MEKILDIKNFSALYPRKTGDFKALDDINIFVEKGESVGIAGESGSGKSTIALGILGLLQSLGTKTTGEILFQDKNILTLPKNNLREIRGKEVSLIFQNPWASLDPLYNIKSQFTEFMQAHQTISKTDAEKIITKSLADVQLPSDENFQKLYPHQLSGGMLQRVAFAMATAFRPKLLIADEPTSSLDVTTQAEIVSLLKNLKQNHQMSLVFISHDLALISQLCDRVYILKKGTIVESGTTADIFTKPEHPYTKALISAIPKIEIKNYEV